MKSSKQDLAERHQSQRPPEADGVQAEQTGHQPIPEEHHRETEHGRCKQGNQCDLQNS